MLSLRYTKIFIYLLIAFVFFGCSTKSSYQDVSDFSRKDAPAIVKDSPSMHRATMRPYTVLGKTYYPTQVSVGDSFSGIASWYGKDFHGKKTSNGEYYDMYAMTAAHKTLPMNTMLRVTNTQNNKSVVLRVNDRGPFVGTRIIDLSYGVATKLAMANQGTAPVRLDVVGFGGFVNANPTVKESVIIDDYFVQIGAFRNKSGAQRFTSDNQNLEGRYSAVMKEHIFENTPIYRVWLKGFGGEDEARDFIARGAFKGSFVVKE